MVVSYKAMRECASLSDFDSKKESKEEKKSKE
jgi:hypothetical protein